MKKTKYGVISDIHGDPRVVPLALDVLKREGIDKLIANGDVGEDQEHIAFVFDQFGKSGLESFIQPGSHEKVTDYKPVSDHFSAEYSNIVDIFKNPKIEFKDHDLIFLPGSDWRAGGQYALEDEREAESGLYPTRDGPLNLTNMNDLRRHVSDPEKTIVVCHVPREFDDMENCVDMAYFAQRNDGSLMPGFIVEDHIREQFEEEIPYGVVEEIATQNGITLRRENRGNKALRNLYEQIGITKAVSGHFHESVHRANDSQSRKVEEGEFVDDLFWNASYLDAGKAGILTVNDSKVNYRNIDLKDYI